MLPVPEPPPIPVAPPSTAAAVAEAERAFAADAVRRGTPAAFLAHLAADGLVFTPEPKNGRAHHGARKEDGSQLRWGPAFVEAAASGDFAVSTGPWSWRAKDGAEPTAFGHFLSLWVRRGGRWQVRLDIGVSHPAQEEAPLRLVLHGPPAASAPGPEAAWAAFDRTAGRDLAAALGEAGDPDLRIYRQGQAVRPGNLATLAAGEAGAAGWEPLGAEVAASRDLAFRWGRRGRAGARSVVLQVWRQADAGWRRAMDVALPEVGRP
nr:nuclear transport factor 2 family protein [Geothrix oryzisoli]